LKKICYLVGQKDSLFKQLVAGLLRDLANNLKLYESQSDDFDDLLNEVSMIKPDMILLDAVSPFSRDSLLIPLLISQPNVPVIVISQDSNEMHIVRRESMLLTSSSDLIKIIN